MELFHLYIGVEPKNRGSLPPKMDGENKGKPQLKWDDLGGVFPPLFFLERPYGFIVHHPPSMQEVKCSGKNVVNITGCHVIS